jgi:hypothetical protein
MPEPRGRETTLQRADLVPDAREPLQDVEADGWGGYGPAQRTDNAEEDASLMEAIDVAGPRTRRVSLHEGEAVNPAPSPVEPLSRDIRIDPES